MKRFFALILSLSLLAGMCLPVFALTEGDITDSDAVVNDGSPVLRLIVPDNWEMTIGDSRSVDAAVGNTENRVVSWSVEPKDIAEIDEWGRVTALKEGTAVVTAQNSDGLTDSAELKVVKTATKLDNETTKIDFEGEAAKLGDNLQKIVTRYEKGSDKVPAEVADSAGYAEAQSAETADGAVWEITNYGVLRTDEKATDERDVLQRFMGDRYFYSADTGDGKVLAIFPDGENGIWTVMQEGYTHIEMIELDGDTKAAQMSDETQKYVSRRGMVSEAYYYEELEKWIPAESDNDGLWTAMYGAGELMRYATLRDDPTATKEEIEAAKKTAYLSAEAVLFLTYISMREGTTEAYVRAQRNGSITDYDTGKYYSLEVLTEGGDYSQNVTFDSPATAFDEMYKTYKKWGKTSYTQDEENLKLFSPESWVDVTADTSAVAAKRTRNLEGFIARTYTLKSEKEAGYSDYNGYIYWSHNGDGTATGMSTEKNGDGSDYLLNNENLRGLEVNATKEIPERLWNDLLGSDIKIEDIVYKGDTSADEVIGHLFIYKLAYDILGPEDPELKKLIVDTMSSFAQHIVDNGYNLVDGSGQPTTWGKYNRTYLHNGQVLGGAPLQTSVILSAFKLAAYITGEQKWEDEYRMAALDEQYQYAKAMAQEHERYRFAILEFANSASPILGFILRPFVESKAFDTLYRMILNYSDEEMAMLAFYLLFQMEDDEELLTYYQAALEDWWYSMSYSENPLWYYVYQLAYPDEEMYDAYGNSLIDTAAWQLSRHPIDTRQYLASNVNRDDIKEFDLEEVGIDGTAILSYDLNGKLPLFSDSDNNILRIIGMVFALGGLDWKVAPADERALHKYNGSSYRLDTDHNPNCMEGSTTYTLPYWMGRYHGLLNK